MEVVDIETGRVLWTTVREDFVERFVFDPTGRYLALRDETGVLLANLATGQERHFDGLYDAWPLAFSSDGKYLVLQPSNDSCAVLYVESDGNPRALGRRWKLVSFSPDGELVATAAGDDVFLFGTGTFLAGGSPFHTLSHPDARHLNHVAVAGVAWLPQSVALAAAARDHLIHVWGTLRGNRITTIAGHHAGVAALAATPDERYLLSFGHDGYARLWDRHFERELCRFSGRAHHFDAQGVQVGFVNAQSAGLYELTPSKSLLTVRTHPPGTRHPVLAFHPSGRWFVTGYQGGFEVWRTSDGEKIGAWYDWWVHSLDFDANGHLLTGSHEGYCRWKVGEPTAGTVQIGPREYIVKGEHLSSFRLSRDKRTLVHADEQILHAIDPEEPNNTTRWENSTVLGAAENRAVTSDGRRVVNFDWQPGSHPVFERGVENAERLPFAGDPLGSIFYFEFSPDDSKLLAAGERSHRLFDTSDWSSVELAPIEGIIRGVGAFSPSGERLALLVSARKIRLLDFKSRRALYHLEPPGNAPVQNIFWSSSGTHLAAFCGAENSVALWNLAVLERELEEIGLGGDDLTFAAPEPVRKESSAVNTVTIDSSFR